MTNAIEGPSSLEETPCKDQDKTLFKLKKMIFLLFLHENLCCWAHSKRLIETLLMSPTTYVYT